MCNYRDCGQPPEHLAWTAPGTRQELSGQACRLCGNYCAVRPPEEPGWPLGRADDASHSFPSGGTGSLLLHSFLELQRAGAM